MQKVSFNRNFGGRASATEFASISIIGEQTGRVRATVVDPSEFRQRENGTVTIYSRRHRSTSVYGQRLSGRKVVGITRDGSTVVLLDL